MARFYEMTNVYDRGPVDINERSQQVQQLFSKGDPANTRTSGRGFNMPVSSREQSQVVFYKRNDGVGSPDLMLYRFRQENSQDSSQTSWVRWRIGKLIDDYQICYVSMPQDKMHVFVRKANRVRLFRIQSDVIENTSAPTVALPVPKFTDGWSGINDVGDKFITKITFPTIYPRGKESYDITANTTVHRLKLSTALIGAYNLNIKRKGYDAYNILVEQTPSDEYLSDPILEIDGALDIPSYPFYGEHIETVPVYTRNKNLTVVMSTDYDAPLTLRSMTWEGDWNPPYYKRV